MPHHPTFRAAVLGAVLVLAPPAAAQAAQLQPLSPCYVSVDRQTREPVEVAGSGFTPGALVDVFIDGERATTQQATATGTLEPAPSVKAPHQKSGQRPFEVRVAEQGNAANSVTTTSRVTALGVTLRPATARPSVRIRWVGRGFLAPGKVYAHYVYRGKSRRTVTLARRKSPCGTFAAQRRQFPFAPRTGRWTVQIDQDRRYRRTPRTNFVQLAIVVSRVSR
jgi:hypothetical protein